MVRFHLVVRRVALIMEFILFNGIIDMIFRINNAMVIVSLVIVYTSIFYVSVEYMSIDINKRYYYAVLVIFTISMIVVFLFGDLFTLFSGWEVLGITSFLLVAHWYTRKYAVLSGLQACIMNRVADIFVQSFIVISSSITYLLWGLVHPVLLSIGVMSKSSIFPLHYWLPNAMESPSPISALLHAATMVTSGIFILIVLRVNIGYEWLATVCLIVFTVYSVSSMDIKKIVAYSTCAQLSVMYLGVNYNMALSHLINHSSYKALLFICLAIIISITYDEQDIRRCVYDIPFLSMTIILGLLLWLSLPGTPTGYSKESILWEAYSHGNLLTVLALGLTYIIMIRVQSYYSIGVGLSPLYTIGTISILGYTLLSIYNRGILMEASEFGSVWFNLTLMTLLPLFMLAPYFIDISFYTVLFTHMVNTASILYNVEQTYLNPIAYTRTPLQSNSSCKVGNECPSQPHAAGLVIPKATYTTNASDLLHNRIYVTYPISLNMGSNCSTTSTNVHSTSSQYPRASTLSLHPLTIVTVECI